MPSFGENKHLLQRAGVQIVKNDAELEGRLWRKRGILLLPLRNNNQKQQWPESIQQALGYVRHRIETVFSTLTTVFNVERPRGRTFAGYVVRAAICILVRPFVKSLSLFRGR